MGLEFPHEIVLYRGTVFLSEIMQCLWQFCGIRHLATTAYHPETNGLCERCNGTLKTIITSYVADHQVLVWMQTMKNYDQLLQRWVWKIQDYQVIFQHISGKENLIANGLSRRERVDTTIM